MNLYSPRTVLARWANPLATLSLTLGLLGTAAATAILGNPDLPDWSGVGSHFPYLRCRVGQLLVSGGMVGGDAILPSSRRDLWTHGAAAGKRAARWRD
jgi:hypothetical protein